MLVSIRSVFLIVLVASAFIFVCMMVWLTRNSPYWINKKLYLGGLLILLIALVNGCQCATQSPNNKPPDDMPTCYAPPPPPIAVDKVTIPTLQTEQKDKITGHLEAMGFSVVHYKDKTIFARKDDQHITINTTNETTSVELSTFDRAPSGMSDDEWKEKKREENKKVLDEIINLVEK